jgi:hypothetical protein
VEIALRADLGQWLVHERQILLSTNTRETKRELREAVKPEVATVSLAQGVFGGERRARIETERAQSNAGEFPKTFPPCASVH